MPRKCNIFNKGKYEIAVDYYVTANVKNQKYVHRETTFWFSHFEHVVACVH